MENPIIETYRGRIIRKYNTLRIRVNQYEMKKFIDAKVDLGLSEKKAIQQKNILCPCADAVIKLKNAEST